MKLSRSRSLTKGTVEYRYYIKVKLDNLWTTIVLPLDVHGTLIDKAPSDL